MKSPLPLPSIYWRKPQVYLLAVVLAIIAGIYLMLTENSFPVSHAQTGPAPDLTAQNFTASRDGAGFIVVDATLLNLGGQSGTFNARLTATHPDGSVVTLVARRVESGFPGAANYIVSGRYPEANVVGVELLLDSENEVSETNETNNNLYVSL